MQIERFEIAERFCGPPRSGNGGYVCGRIASPLQGAVAVRLKAPPPLEAELRLESDDDTARLFHADTLIGEAKRIKLDLLPPPCPGYEEAQAAVRSFLGFNDHRFPGCFVCGPQRASPDGLRIFPGALNDESLEIAAPWTPDASLADAAGHVKPEFLWSALDCTGSFTHLPLPEGKAIVLGELAASIVGDVKPGERCVVVGWPMGVEGRRRLAGTAIYAAADQHLVAVARAVWIEVPASGWS